MNCKLLLHLDVTHAVREGRDDGLLRHPGDLKASVVGMLDELLQGLSWLLLDAAKSLMAGGRSRVPWKLVMKRVLISLQEENVSGARFRSQVRAPSLSAMGNQFAMTFSSPLAASMLSS